MDNSDKTSPSLPAKKRNFETFAASGGAAALVAAHAAAIEKEPTEQEISAMSRSERKRHREKKRRSDVNKGFDELMTLLLEIDPEVRADAEERTSRGQTKRILGAHEDNVLSRVDLISTAIRVLKRIHSENEKHKDIIGGLIKNGQGGNGASATTTAVGAVGGSGASASALGRSNPAVTHASQGTGNNSLAAALSGRGFASSSLLDPVLFQQSALGLSGGTAGGGPDVFQLRHALGLSGVSHQLGGLSHADILTLRAASSGGGGAGGGRFSSAMTSDAALLAHLRNNSSLHRNVLQNLLQPQQQDPPSLSNGAGGIGSGSESVGPVTQVLYGAIVRQEGQIADTKEDNEEELRRLRDSGQM